MRGAANGKDANTATMDTLELLSQSTKLAKEREKLQDTAAFLDLTRSCSKMVHEYLASPADEKGVAS